MTYYERNLPHWHPEGRILFVTWRLFGSLPASVIAKIESERDHPGRQFTRAEKFLDAGRFGPLFLRDEQIALTVERCILHGAQVLHRYDLLAYVVMPNHVHMLIKPLASLSLITHGIKGVSAQAANRLLERTGKAFWQGESFDHWVRSDAECSKIRAYVEDNPVKAGFVSSPEDWRWSSAAKK